MTRVLRERGYFKRIKYNNNEPDEFLKAGNLIVAHDTYRNKEMKCARRQTYVTWAGIQWIKGILEDILIDKGLIPDPAIPVYHDF